ncbi:MAG: universal stress protein [Verrucomicrobia bacterium]|nr:universal stress protein [Verrucomicrobiota bacterium]
MKPSEGIEFRIRHLIVPLDGSRLAEAALPIARQLARKLSAPITLVHLLERHPPHHIHGEHHLSSPEEAEQYLSELGHRISPSDPKVEQHVHATKITDVPRAIAEHATELGSDLVVMCAHGQIGLRTLLFGSIAQKVAASSAVPVFLIRPGHAGAAPILTERPILVLLDGAAVDEQTLPLAAALARVCGGSLHLVVAVPTLRTLSGVGAASGLLLPATTATILQLAQADASKYLSRRIALLEAKGLLVDGEVLRGEPSEIIVKTARHVAPDLIVLGIHNEEGLANFLSNHAVTKVASCTPLPLLLVRESRGNT